MSDKKIFLYFAVADKIERYIKDNGLLPADKIPSVRKISKMFGVSISTVIQAFDLLTGRGVIISKERSGYYVNATKCNQIEPTLHKYSMPTHVEMNEMASTMMINAKKYAIANFSILSPVPEVLPVAKINKKIAEALRNPQNTAFGYPLIEGDPKLIDQIVRSTLQWSVPLKNNEVLITNGCMEAINLCLDVVTKEGDIVLIEKPSYQGILQSLDMHGLKALEIPVSLAEGIDLNLLQESLLHNKVAACLLMPRLNNPMGTSMSNDKKEQLLNILDQYDIPLIEDDALGELLFESYSKNYPAKAFDTNRNVLYCSSFTKTLVPGFRIGWVCGGRYHEDLKKRKYATNIATNEMLQNALALYLETGQFENHLRKLRLETQKNLLKYVDAIQKYFPRLTRISIPQGGLSLWIELPANINTMQLQQIALSEKIGICPGNIFTTVNDFNHFIRLNYCTLWNKKTDDYLLKLGKICTKYNLS